MPMNPAVQAVIKAITRLQPDVANSWNSQRKVEDPIEAQFMAAVKEVKKEIGHDFTVQQVLTKEAAERMFTELTKGEDMGNPKVTPEQVTELIIDSVAGMDGVNQEALDKLGQALTAFMQTTLDQAAKQEKDDEKPEQRAALRSGTEGEYERP